MQNTDYNNLKEKAFEDLPRVYLIYPATLRLNGLVV